MADTADNASQTEILNTETPVAPNGRSTRMPVIVVSLSTLVLVCAAATVYAWPNFNIALPNFDSLAELFPRATAPAPIIPDPVVSAALKDIQSAQQQNVAALQENEAALQQNTAMLQQGAATLESVKQGFSAQQTDMKRISNQLSSLIARVDSLQNAMTPLTTSSISQPKARARVASRKKAPRPLKPFGPVSVGGAPLSPAPPQSAG